MQESLNSLHQPNAHESRIASFINGWALSLLMLALITLSGVVVSLSWDGENVWRFSAVAFLGGLFAALVARTRFLDGMAMLLCVIVGVVVIWILTALFSGMLEGGSWERIRGLPEPIWLALGRDSFDDINRELTAETLLSATIWMSSWIAMWMLLRVGYVVFALVPPIVLILANEHFSTEDRVWPLIVMVALSILIIVRQRFNTQRRSWSVQKVQVSESVAGKVLVSGLAIAVVVSSTLMVSPAAWSQTVLQPIVTGVVDRLESARLEVEYWFDDVLGTDMAPTAMGNYTDFSDGFSVGGPLNLSDTPEVSADVNSMSAPYLTARSYDNYTGRGWTSSSAGEFADADGGARQSPELMYNPSWEVVLSPEARNEREPTTATITTLGPQTDLVLTVDSFLTADVQTVVRMSWSTVADMPLAVTAATLNQLPPDVQKLARFLLQSQLNGQSTSWGPSPVSGNMRAAIDEEVNDLAGRGIEVRWTASPDGIVDTLYITGRLPVFDDVEAVFRRQVTPENSGGYTVTGLTSVASPEQLAAAEGSYPAWVTERYLQTGDTVTDRTMQLTQDIVGAETNPYEQAVLIEQWLRTNIVYDDTVEAPPRGRDLVDYVLFDNQRGYCEHYSAAMTVMLRSLGIPARVVVGYSPGELDPETGEWIYLQSNAHAWVEAYFPGYGWIPFEPTANRPLGEFDLEPGEATEADDNQPEEAVETQEPAVPTAEVATPDVNDDNTQATPMPTSSDETMAPPSIVSEEEDSGPPGWFVAAVASVASLGVVSVAGWLLWQRGLRGLSPGAAMMKRVQRVGGWLGIRSRTTTTPREYAREFEHAANPIAGPVKRITRAYEIETFGPQAARNRIVEDTGRAWREIRGKALYLLRNRRKSR